MRQNLLDAGCSQSQADTILSVGNKELMIIPGAVHCDLYDGGTHGYIPFDKLESFFKASFVM